MTEAREGSGGGGVLQGLYPEELEAAVREAGGEAWRARQVWGWVQGRHALSWEEMRNVPGRLRESLAAAGWEAAAVRGAKESADPGGTVKWLLELRDGELIEMVRIPGGGGRETVCVSTQAGCRMGCAFCATAKSGFARSLEAGEIVAQVHWGARALGRRPDNVVLMGMGEPFDNYDATMRAVRLMNHPEGLGIGARKITISTCGVVEGIRRLAGEGLQVELSVSLHAPNPEIRRRLMPAERRWGMESVLAECAAYTAQTKRIVTFEYTLVRGVNDGPEHAAELARRLRTFPCRVNLIPLSPVAEFDGETPSRERVEVFLRELRRRGVEGTIRESRGKGVNGACGQLRRGVKGAE
ncbi:MAG: 23S rRNA (adenine(2503)-C(2))-methyltransferase RlmN [Kiritimatiellae bacterium]|nr:23S rRNA (adenine(2503)-C(2))-methyltransferase RlmN [Kiritimatiellia bacterium]